MVTLHLYLKTKGRIEETLPTREDAINRVKELKDEISYGYVDDGTVVEWSVLKQIIEGEDQ